jgi:V/A-type H+-transporting ATPase subunit D
MAKLVTAPTRSNYLRMEKSLDRAQRGYDLLERKRQILVMELMDRMEAAKNIQMQVRLAMEKAYEALRKAARSGGIERLLREGCGMQGGHRVRVNTRSVMGVQVPEISFSGGHKKLPFGLLAGMSGADEVRESFHDALELTVQLAEVETAVLRLTRELKKTQRRVNALENTFIPNYEETLDFIGDSLEERAREDLVVMKKVKQIQEKKLGKTRSDKGKE